MSAGWRYWLSNQKRGHCPCKCRCSRPPVHSLSTQNLGHKSIRIHVEACVYLDIHTYTSEYLLLPVYVHVMFACECICVYRKVSVCICACTCVCIRYTYTALKNNHERTCTYHEKHMYAYIYVKQRQKAEREGLAAQSPQYMATPFWTLYKALLLYGVSKIRDPAVCPKP